MKNCCPCEFFSGVLAVRRCALWPMNPAHFWCELWLNSSSHCGRHAPNAPPLPSISTPPPQLPTAQFTSRSATHTHTRPHTNTLGWRARNVLIPSPVEPEKLQTLCAASLIPADAWLPHIYIGKCRTNGFTYQTLCVIGAALGPPHKSSGRAVLEPEVGGHTQREGS